MSLTYQVLIATIPHRHEKLCGLLAHLDAQALPGFGALVCRDNLEHTTGQKRQALLDAAQARYVSHVDDDDWVPGDFVARILAALEQDPDYVGFPIRYTEEGLDTVPVEHSLRHRGWFNYHDRLLRDISHLNPMRRNLAKLGRFDYHGSSGRPTAYGEDSYWAQQIRQTRRLRTEAWIGVPMYHYRFSFSDNSKFVKKPLPAQDIPPLPSYPWLTVAELA